MNGSANARTHKRFMWFDQDDPKEKSWELGTEVVLSITTFWFICIVTVYTYYVVYVYISMQLVFNINYSSSENVNTINCVNL